MAPDDRLSIPEDRRAHLRVVPNGPGGLDLRHVRPDGTFLVLEGGDRFRRRTFRLDSREYEIRREGGAGDWLLREGLFVHARARKRRPGSRAIELRLLGRPYVLRPLSPLHRTYQLVHGPAVVGEIRPVRHVSREGLAILPVELSEPLRVFTSSLAAVAWWRLYALRWLLILGA
jgi:hypothetical protein